jgi:hypothetical protein
MEDNFVATFTLMVRKDLAGDAVHFSRSPHLRRLGVFRRPRAAAPAFLDTETAWQHGHAGPRITRIDPLVFAQARLTVLEARVGRDAAFRPSTANATASCAGSEHVRASPARSGHARHARPCGSRAAARSPNAPSRGCRARSSERRSACSRAAATTARSRDRLTFRQREARRPPG